MYYTGSQGPRQRPTHKTPWPGFLRWVTRVMFRPTPVMLEVTYEVPLLKCLALLGAIYLAVVIGLFVIGPEGLVNFDLQTGPLASLGVVFGILTYVVATHWLAHKLEGQGSLDGLIAGAIFSLVPFFLFALVSLVLGLLPIGDARAEFQGLTLFVVLGWTAFLYSVAVRENNTFTDIQAVISMLLPPAIIAVSVGTLFVVGYLVIILFL